MALKQVIKGAESMGNLKLASVWMDMLFNWMSVLFSTTTEKI
jgi:hypothetical protein